MTATCESLAEWARGRSLRAVPDIAASIGGRAVEIGGAVTVEFRKTRPHVVVKWDGGARRAEFDRGVPLAALTGLITGLLGLDAETPKRRAWHEDWEVVDRDQHGNAILKHRPTEGLYRILPIEES